MRFRCHVGHQFSELGFAHAKDEEIELALWTALRTLKESAALHGSMAERATAGGRALAAVQFEQVRAELHAKAELLRRVLGVENDA